jgi:hypothetical protein
LGKKKELPLGFAGFTAVKLSKEDKFALVQSERDAIKKQREKEKKDEAAQKLSDLEDLYEPNLVKKTVPIVRNASAVSKDAGERKATEANAEKTVVRGRKGGKAEVEEEEVKEEEATLTPAKMDFDWVCP